MNKKHIGVHPPPVYSREFIIVQLLAILAAHIIICECCTIERLRVKFWTWKNKTFIRHSHALALRHTAITCGTCRIAHVFVCNLFVRCFFRFQRINKINLYVMLEKMMSLFSLFTAKASCVVVLCVCNTRHSNNTHRGGAWWWKMDCLMKPPLQETYVFGFPRINACTNEQTPYTCSEVWAIHLASPYCHIQRRTMWALTFHIV